MNKIFLPLFLFIFSAHAKVDCSKQLVSQHFLSSYYMGKMQYLAETKLNCKQNASMEAEIWAEQVEASKNLYRKIEDEFKSRGLSSTAVDVLKLMNIRHQGDVTAKDLCQYVDRISKTGNKLFSKLEKQDFFQMNFVDACRKNLNLFSRERKKVLKKN